VGVVLLDYVVKRQQSKPSAVAAGVVTITFAQVPADQRWRVDGMVVRCPNASGASVLCQVYDLPVGPNVVPIEKTRSGTLDVADQSSPLTIPAGGQLTFVFSNVDLGVIAYVRIQYGLYSGTQGAPTPVAAS
jgi:hypothetical protein